jgi:hypothetical protein
MPPIDPPPESLTKDLLQHLSKEIETTSNNMMVFRTRIGFGLLVGPFLLLGSLIVGAKGQPVATHLRWYAVPAIVVVFGCYLVIAYIASEIEAHALEQCNRWREIIGGLCKKPPMEIDSTKLKSKLLWRVEWLRRVPILRRDWNGVTTGYVVGYVLLFVAVIAAVFLVNAAAPENRSDSGPPFRIELVTPTPQVSDNGNKSLPKK